MKKLNELIECSYDIDILGISEDSRKISDGYLFVATHGYNVDHYDYIGDAVNRGAVAVITDQDILLDIPVIVVSDIDELYPKLVAKYYDLDLSRFNFIGITGTDGKTTSTTIIRKLLNKIRPTAYIGTNGVEYCGKKINSSNTTPCISELYEYLSIISKENCYDVVMEVSSEALLHKRIVGIEYKVVGYTNITEDHLNVHGSIENYIECKKSLMNYLCDDGVSIINGDDPVCSTFSGNVIKYGFNEDNDCRICLIEENKNNTKFYIDYLSNRYKIKSPYIGTYNIYNVVLAFLVCLNYGVAPEYLVDNISTLGSVTGRRESLDFGQDYEIILDYAHTYNGIVNVLSSVSSNKRIIVVTGCAGGREKEKRKLIGNYILNNSDIAIFTMDDPRYESVDSIIDQMVEGSNKEYIRIIDRKDAIYKALSIADNNSVVLILGKGRDSYMAVEDKYLPYCDYDVISSYFM